VHVCNGDGGPEEIFDNWFVSLNEAEESNPTRARGNIFEDPEFCIIIEFSHA
jgi:hypothetical protein